MNVQDFSSKGVTEISVTRSHSLTDAMIDKEEEEEQTQIPTPTLTQKISRIAVARICTSLGFVGAKTSALDVLSDIAIRYIQSLSKSATCNANSLRRTDSNVFDVIRAMEDLSFITGFSGAWDHRRSILKSGVLRDVYVFVRSTKEVPFRTPIKTEIGSINLKMSPSFFKSGKPSPFSHIPSWLPEFPDPSTYKILKTKKFDRKRMGEIELPHCEDQHKNPLVIESMQKHDLLPEKRSKVMFRLPMKNRDNRRVGLPMESMRY